MTSMAFKTCPLPLIYYLSQNENINMGKKIIQRNFSLYKILLMISVIEILETNILMGIT